MPASRQRWRSSAKALAVMARMGRRPRSPRARIARVASSPSITGICMSISTSARPLRRTASTAAWPSGTASTRSPTACSSAWPTSRLKALSSASSTRVPANRRRSADAGSDAAAPGVPGSRLRPRASRAVNQKVLPWPGRLSAPASPSIRRASRRVIARPSPVPPCWRATPGSACEKASNNTASWSARSPGPVSLTSKRSRTASADSSSSRTAIRMRPVSVNFTALPT